MAQLGNGNLNIYIMKKFIEFVYVWALTCFLYIIVSSIADIDTEDIRVVMVIMIMCSIISGGLTRALFKYLNKVTVERSEIEP